MATIANNTVWPLVLPIGTTLTRGQIVTLSNADLDSFDMARALPALVASGAITVTRGADMPPADPGAAEASPPRRAEADKPADAGDVEQMPGRLSDPEPDPVVEPESAPKGKSKPATAPDTEAAPAP